MSNAWWDAHEWEFVVLILMVIATGIVKAVWMVALAVKVGMRERQDRRRLLEKYEEEEPVFDEDNRIITRGPSGFLYCSPRDSRNCEGCPGPPSDGRCGMDQILEGKAAWRKGKKEVRNGLEEG